jgi:hypothetical protein
MSEKRNITIFIDKRVPGVVQPNGSYDIKNANDFYITVGLFKEKKLLNEYIEVNLDPTREKIERQEINPFFNEFGFFNSIEKIEGEGSNFEVLKKKAETYNIEINS